MYIDKDETGKIKGIYRIQQYEGQKSVEENNSDILAYQEEHKKSEYNNTIKANLEAIDRKRIRAMCEGGVNDKTGKAFLDEYTEQAKEERAKLL